MIQSGGLKVTDALRNHVAERDAGNSRTASQLIQASLVRAATAFKSPYARLNALRVCSSSSIHSARTG